MPSKARDTPSATIIVLCRCTPHFGRDPGPDVSGPRVGLWPVRSLSSRLKVELRLALRLGLCHLMRSSSTRAGGSSSLVAAWACVAMRSPTLWVGEAVERDQYCDHPVVIPGSSWQ